ncbi:MAG: hypothetical protein RSD13_01355 [Clostridium sp.]|uniref:hypothetical protein n=1 Tax=Clostridium sp. TaxID=1506 RepID=UPI002FC7C822
MSDSQKIILKYVSAFVNLKSVEIILEYDKKSVIILDENIILHFKYLNHKVVLINSNMR